MTGRRRARAIAAGVAAALLLPMGPAALPASARAVPEEIASAPTAPRRVDLRVVATGFPACTKKIKRVRITIDNVRSTVPVVITVKINGRTVVKRRTVRPRTGWPRVDGRANTFRLPKAVRPATVVVSYTANARGLAAPVTGRDRPTRYCRR